LIADSGNDRVLKVTPDGQVVWEYEISRGSYNFEQVRYGEEPRGPPMYETGPLLALSFGDMF
jgi:hypothetical protein